MIIIIKWHIIKWEKKPIDFGARMCEILFVSSGFLVGYNHYKKIMPTTFQQSFKYVYKSLRTFYPLEILNLILNICLSKNFKIKKINLTTIEILISNIFIIKSWSRYKFIYFSFNGISWFLSSLLFCYFMTPFLLIGIRKIKFSLILFFIIALIRIGIEEFIRHGALNIFDFKFHVGPIIRCLEFYLGMLTSPLFFYFKFYLDKKANIKLFKLLFTLLQIILPIIVYFLMIKYDKIIHRCYFILIFCVFLFIIGLDYGCFSDIFSLEISKKIMNYQMEMYLFHLSVNKLILKLIQYTKIKFKISHELNFFLKLIIIFTFAFLYKKIMKEKFTNFMDKIIDFFKNIFYNEQKFYEQIKGQEKNF